MNYTLIGSPCGEHGPYKFYKGFRYTKNGKTNILALSEFFFVKLWPDSDLISIGELQLLWEDKNSEQTLASLRLYILPENTPDGRNDIHGEDEVLAINEKVVLRVEDLLSWITTASDWHWGLGAVWTGDVVKEEKPEEDTIKAEPESSDVIPKEEAPEPTTNDDDASVTTSPPLYPSKSIDMEDIIKEKLKLDKGIWETTMGVVVLSYPRYCRYRGLLKRLEGVYNKWLRNSLVLALGGFTVPFRNTRVLFCKETFDYPDLEGHEMLCNHLAPKLKGRPRRKRKKINFSSEDSESDSESSQSTSSSGTKTKVSGMKPRLRCTLEVSRVPPSGSPSILTLSGGLQKAAAEEKRFLANLHAFMRSRNTPIQRIPVVGFKEVNLYKLYKKVGELGGYDAVTDNKLWKHVYEVTGGDLSCSSPATLSRRHYEKLLLPYERFLKGHQLKSKVHPSIVVPNNYSLPQHARIGSVKISPLRNIRLKPEKFGEKENIPYRRPPIGGASVTIIKTDGVKKEVIDLASPDASPVKGSKGSSVAPPMIKKQKLEMLKEGGLEVTPISGSGGATVRPVSGAKAMPAGGLPSAKSSASSNNSNNNNNSSSNNNNNNNKVSITVTPDMTHLMYPWVMNGPGPSKNKEALIYGGGCALGLPVETVMGSSQPNPIDLRTKSTKPINIGSNLEISLVPAKKSAPPTPPPVTSSIPKYTLLNNQVYTMKAPSAKSYLPVIDPAYLCGNIVTQRVNPHFPQRAAQPQPSSQASVNFYKDILRSQGIFSLLPDGSTSISLVGKSTPTSK